MPENAYFVTLPNRGQITLSGPDRRGFLQGLISNDINLLDSQPCVYACLLNAQGKFLHDFFITEKDAVINLDCEGGARAQNLFKRCINCAPTSRCYVWIRILYTPSWVKASATPIRATR
jgi:folate-binding Fe-S cluster repair protein YgfZ